MDPQKVHHRNSVVAVGAPIGVVVEGLAAWSPADGHSTHSVLPPQASRRAFLNPIGPRVPALVQGELVQLAPFAVGKFQGKSGLFDYTVLDQEYGQMVVLRLTAHGQKQDVRVC